MGTKPYVNIPYLTLSVSNTISNPGPRSMPTSLIKVSTGWLTVDTRVKSSRIADKRREMMGLTVERTSGTRTSRSAFSLASLHHFLVPLSPPQPLGIA